VLDKILEIRRYEDRDEENQEKMKNAPDGAEPAGEF